MTSPINMFQTKGDTTDVSYVSPTTLVNIDIFSHGKLTDNEDY